MITKVQSVLIFLVGCILGGTFVCAQANTNDGRSSENQAYFSRGDGFIRLGNRFLEMRFSSQNGEIQALIHKKSGVDLKKEKVNCYHTLWGMGVYTKEGKRSWTDNARSGEFFRPNLVRVERVGQELNLHLFWEKILLDNGESYPASVRATISVRDDSPFGSWKINVHNSGPYAIEKIAYPFICGVQELGLEGSDDCLVVPTLEGRLYHNPAQNLQATGNTYPSCFLNMQFAAYYDNKAGFYLACYDNQGYVKRFTFGRHDQRWAMMSFDHYCNGIKYGADFVPPYPVTVGVFEGDWYTAADIYKQWAANQWWANKKIREKNTPMWVPILGESSCFVRSVYHAQQGKSLADIVRGAKNHRDYFNAPLLVQLWGWENKGAWSFGDYFPPIEGWNSFDTMVKGLHASGCKLNTYVSAESLDRRSDLWESQKPLPYAVRDEGGNLHKGCSMCPATPFWRKYLEEVAVELTNHGVDIIQFDCFPIPPHEVPCFDSTHGHLPGLGKWQTDARIENLKEIEATCRAINQNVCFTSEGVVEIYIPYLDVAKYWRDVCSEVGMPEPGFEDGTSEIIPLFNYVYHEYIICMEEQVCGPNVLRLSLSRFREYNHLCIGRMLTWGAIPLIWAEEPVDSPSIDKDAFDLVRRVASARTTYAKDFLVYGRMQRPLIFSVPVISVPVFGSLKDPKPKFQIQVPSVMHSVWKADDGSVGVVFVNIAKDPVSIKLSLDFRQLGLRLGAAPFLYCVRDGKHSILKTNSDSVEPLDVTIQPREIIFIGLCKTDGPRAQQVRQFVANGNPQ